MAYNGFKFSTSDRELGGLLMRARNKMLAWPTRELIAEFESYLAIVLRLSNAPNFAPDQLMFGYDLFANPDIMTPEAARQAIAQLVPKWQQEVQDAKLIVQDRAAELLLQTELQEDELFQGSERRLQL